MSGLPDQSRLNGQHYNITGYAARRLWVGAAVAAGAGLLIVLALTLAPPVPQDPTYHALADSRPLAGMPNAQNVLSNLPFVLIGVWALMQRGRWQQDQARGFPSWEIFAVCLMLTGLGSAYYHWAPDNHTLVWDRLPIALMTMAVTTAVLSEHLRRGLEKVLLWPLLGVAAASVWYWWFTEEAGRGDLRAYALVQFLPLLIVPVVVLALRSRFTRATDLLVLLGFYVLARAAELQDHAVMNLTGGLTSGHTLKHLFAAVGAWWVARMLCIRHPV